MSEQEDITEPTAGQAPAETEPINDQTEAVEQQPLSQQASSSPTAPAPDDNDASAGEATAGSQPDSEAGPGPQANAGSEAKPEPEATAEPEPETTAEPESQPEAGKAQQAQEQAPEKDERQRQPFASRPARRPSRLSEHFIACPRCSYFLAGYRLIYQDFDDAADSATGDWLDLSWNLSVRNLLAKSYGYEMAEPLDAMQGVCPSCQRAFVFEAADPDDSEATGDRFSIQIKARP